MDINEGLSGSYDLIQMRCISNGIKDINSTIKELQSSLKPGLGLLLLLDGDAEYVFHSVPDPPIFLMTR